MAINLTKGQKISLTKECPSLREITVGLGWDINGYSGGFDFDLDASCFICGDNGKVRSDEDFIFYSNLVSADGSVKHTGDNRTGSGDGDDEEIIVDLSKVADNVSKIAFTVTIYDAIKRNQNFGQVSNAYVRLIDNLTGKELLRFNLGEDFSIETAIVVCELYKYNGEWKFNAIGSGYSGGLAALCSQYGIDANAE